MSDFPSSWGNYLVQGIVETTAPQPISFWPQTIGWQIIALILLFYMVKKLYQAGQAYKQNAYRREALAWLNNLPGYFNLDEQPVYRQLPSLIRKTALCAFGRDQVSPLSNKQWDQWLDEQCDKTSFVKRCASHLHILAYAPNPQLKPQQIESLINEINLWIKFHRRQDD